MAGHGNGVTALAALLTGQRLTRESVIGERQ